MPDASASPQMEIVYTKMPIHPCIDSVVYRADLPWLRHSQATAYARRGRGVQDACEPYLRQTRGEEPSAGRPDCYTILPVKLDICEYSSTFACELTKSPLSCLSHCGRSPTTTAYVRSSVPRPRAGLRSTTWSTRRIRYPMLSLDLGKPSTQKGTGLTYSREWSCRPCIYVWLFRCCDEQSQMPDLIITLLRGSTDCEPVSFCRIPAAELLSAK
jgi:hypothetical protein